jgi:predicted RND superfamily exporter protein
LFSEVREDAQDINQYLDAERTRKQADNAMRLTVVTACGMVGTIVTGFLGMNIFEHHQLPPWEKLAVFLAVFIPTVALSVYTVVVSKRLATFMEALSSERLGWVEKASLIGTIFRSRPRDQRHEPLSMLQVDRSRRQRSVAASR